MCYLKYHRRDMTEKGEVFMVRRRFAVLTILLLLVIIFCVKGTVMSKENNERARQNHYYAVLEKEYLMRTQSLLEEEGYRNCGINMRRVTYEDGSREYTVLLHHRKLDRMSSEEKMVLEELLSKKEFRDEACSFRYEL